jgi:molybdate transport system substrate-binding protein
MACSSKPPGETVHVAAASDLTKAFDEIGKEFASRSGITLIIDYGSSGLLAKQIENGAPYTLFAAASRDYVDQVVKAGKCDGGSAQMYSVGRLVVWTKGEPLSKLADLADPKYKRVAIANPDHAPYGRAARAALQKAGVWDQIQDRLVLAESVQAAMTYAREGSADVAVVARALAVADGTGHALDVDPTLHPPLEQVMVVCGTGEEAAAARKLATFVMSPEGREVMTRYGFSVSGEK